MSDYQDDYDDPVAELAADLAAKLCEVAGHRHRYPDCREPERANRRAVIEGGATYFPTAAERLRLAS